MAGANANENLDIASILGSGFVQGVGYLGYAVGLLIIDKNYTGAYQDVLKAVVSFGGQVLAGKLAADLQKLSGPAASDVKKS